MRPQVPRMHSNDLRVPPYAMIVLSLTELLLSEQTDIGIRKKIEAGFVNESLFNSHYKKTYKPTQNCISKVSATIFFFPLKKNKHTLPFLLFDPKILKLSN